jgi:predicted hotdog family 3-hydroxylacyl-ACP dehydratase
MGDRLMGKMLIAAVGYWHGVVSHREELIKIREGTALSVRSLVNPGPMTCGLAATQTNQQTN